MADKIKDSVLNSVVGGKDEGITYKYKSGDCFRSISIFDFYYEIIEPAGYIDIQSNSPVYKCYMYCSNYLLDKKYFKIEKDITENALDISDKIDYIPKEFK